MSNMFISGIASGIDWNGMVAQLIENARRPAYVHLVRRDNLEMKKSFFEEFLVSLRGLQSTLSPLRLNSTFKAKELIIDRLDSNASHRGVLTATASADAAVNVHDLEVLQLARGQTTRSRQFADTSNLGISANSHFYIHAAGQRVRIEVSSTDTLETLAGKINAELRWHVPPVAVSASIVDRRLVLTSNETGTGQETISTTLWRGLNATDPITFLVNPNSPASATYTMDMGLGINGGELKITHGNHTYVQGRDFDIVNGNEIRWHNQSFLYPPVGKGYQINYSAAIGDTIDYSVNVSSAREIGNNGSFIDRGVLKFDIVSRPAGAPPFEIDDGTNTYTEGTHFAINGRDVVWDTTAVPNPPTGSYHIQYTCNGGEEFKFDMARSNVDTVTGATYADLAGAGRSTVIIHGAMTYRQGVDFDIVNNGAGDADISWRAGVGHAAPPPGANYDIRVYGVNGTLVNTFPGVTRNPEDHLTFYDDTGFTLMAGAGTLDASMPDGTIAGNVPGVSAVVTWNPTLPPPPRPATYPQLPPTSWNSNSPVDVTNAAFTVSYTYNKNTFHLDDEGNGVLEALGFVNSYGSYANHTEARNAIIRLGGEDGQIIELSSNDIGAGYGNEIDALKGITLQLRGTGRVAIDVEHDANYAVEAINRFITSYNDVMRWINVRLTENMVDESVRATLDNDDFRRRWGLLAGNSLLRSTKDSMRRLPSQTFTPRFTERTARSPVYGTMQQNGLSSPTNITITMGARHLVVDVNPGETLREIVDNKINNPNYPHANGNALYYDPNGYMNRVARASIVDGRLVINSERADWLVSLGGSNQALAAMGVDYGYTSLSQIGIRLPSTGGGMTDDARAGILEFDTNKFMEAMRESPDDVAALFSTFAAQMDSFLADQVRTSQIELAPGVVTIQGAVAREMSFIDDEIRRIDKYLTDFDKRLQRREQALHAQFSQAEVAMSKLLQQAQWLASVTAQLQAQQAANLQR